jgi:hypothetical protein
MDATATDSRECPFCLAWFSRVDAAKRHTKRCPQREGRPLVDRKRGRRARSCVQCSRVKVHCQPRREGPCERCVPRKLPCSFDGCSTNAATHIVPSTEISHVSDRCGDRIPLSFLLNATDDQQDFLTERTVGMEPDAAPLGPACLLLRSFDSSESLLDFLDPSVLLLFEHETRVTPISSEFPSHHAGDFTFSEPWDITMSARLESLENEIIKSVGCSPERSISFDTHAYRSFFSARNAREFITRFCRKRHYRYQIIHWPTFEPENVSLALLMVVCLTGAAYSFGEDHGAAHAIQARSFYQVADSYVFQQLEKYLHGSPTDLNLVTSIELCQAALLMYALDALPAGDMAMQHTAVARRLPTLIDALRILGFVNVQHGSSQDWGTFIHHEQRIRLVAWAFCADCLATLSCNKPPGFSILEMRGELPCDSNVWDADATAFHGLRECSRQATPLPLTELMSLCSNGGWRELSGSLRPPLFHLHVMLCGKSPSLCLEPVLLTTTRRARSLTQIYCSLPTHCLQLSGFDEPRKTV